MVCCCSRCFQHVDFGTVFHFLHRRATAMCCAVWVWFFLSVPTLPLPFSRQRMSGAYRGSLFMLLLFLHGNCMLVTRCEACGKHPGGRSCVSLNQLWHSCVSEQDPVLKCISSSPDAFCFYSSLSSNLPSNLSLLMTLKMFMIL